MGDIRLDTFIEKGSSHSLCEDYVGTAETDFNKIGIISDGCSSTENADIGSRIITKVAEQELPKADFFDGRYGKLKEIGGRIIGRSESIAKAFGLDDKGTMDLLSATLGVMYVNSHKFRIAYWGDGSFIIKYKDGKIELRDIEYEGNAPYYLSYSIDSYLDEQFKNRFGNYKTRVYTLEDDELTSKLESSAQVDQRYSFACKSKEVESVFLCSDGIMSFRDLHQEELPIQRLLEEMTNFKNTKGKFLQRRMNKFLKDIRKENYNNFDDISIVTALI